MLDAVPLRPCTLRIPARGRGGGAVRAVRAAPLRRARAPGTRTSTGYAPAVSAWRELVDGADDGPLHALADEVADAVRRGSGSRRPPAGATGSPASSGRSAARSGWPRSRGLAEVVGARPDGQRGLGAGGGAPRPARRRPGWRAAGVPPMPVVEALRAGAADGAARARAAARGRAEEVRLLHRWLDRRRHPAGPAPAAVGEPARGAGGWADVGARARPVAVAGGLAMLPASTP